MAKILIIEDDLTTRLILKQSLYNAGHEVIIAETGESGLEKAKQLHPDLIICDWMMPVMDGLEVCRRVKNTPQLATIFFILLTGREEIDDRVKGLDSGADEFLLKPIDINELKARVRAGLRLGKLMQDLWRSNQALADLNQQLLYRNQMLELMSLTDPLTGLLNRRALQQTLPNLMQEIRRRDPVNLYRYLGVFMIDVDRFKTVNDNYGHGVGDAVLKILASRLMSGAVMKSSLYRYGGEEIACLLPLSNDNYAGEYGESMRLAIADKPFEISPTLSLNITISIGGVIWSADYLPGGTPSTSTLNYADELLNQADIALYQAKRDGRNCLRIKEFN
ncbi:diguanylate cyclase [[Phormidium] sp. ETS-05]|uniref:diguanylate cyclase n=1 Tax=[Phormidium] sp. ETS-05 TaxID=222819 RepID=UPI0018EEE345|nr:diguanylate cyclase [[Phormidium] sp. ETS-05]